MIKLAPRFRISDVALRKRCIANRIPCPRAGYWRRVETGKPTVRPALPDIPNARPIRFTMQPRPGTPGLIEPGLLSFEAANPIVVGSDLDDLDPIAQALCQDFAGQLPDRAGCLVGYGAEALRVRVHHSSATRVLLLVDAFARACRSRGFSLVEGMSGQRHRSYLAVIVDGFAFFPVIEERVRRVLRMEDDSGSRETGEDGTGEAPYAYEPTGELTLRIEGGYGSGLQDTWKDSRHRRIEGRLNEVMIVLRAFASHRLQVKRQASERRARYDAIQQERAAIRASVEAERQAVTTLEDDATAWKRAERLRSFARAAEIRAIEEGNLPATAKWLRWAHEQADRLDPLRESPPSLLDTPEHEFRAFEFWQMGESSPE